MSRGGGRLRKIILMSICLFISTSKEIKDGMRSVHCHSFFCDTLNRTELTFFGGIAVSSEFQLSISMRHSQMLSSSWWPRTSCSRAWKLHMRESHSAQDIVDDCWNHFIVRWWRGVQKNWNMVTILNSIEGQASCTDERYLSSRHND